MHAPASWSACSPLPPFHCAAGTPLNFSASVRNTVGYAYLLLSGFRGRSSTRTIYTEASYATENFPELPSQLHPQEFKYGIDSHAPKFGLQNSSQP
jgi:hypothetical protein